MKPVADQLRELKTRHDELLRTLCVRCGHPYNRHFAAQSGLRCYADGPTRATTCRCRQWIDPAEYER